MLAESLARRMRPRAGDPGHGHGLPSQTGESGPRPVVFVHEQDAVIRSVGSCAALEYGGACVELGSLVAGLVAEQATHLLDGRVRGLGQHLRGDLSCVRPSARDRRRSTEPLFVGMTCPCGL